MSMEDLLAGGLSLERPGTPDDSKQEDLLTGGVSLERPESTDDEQVIQVAAWEGPPGFSAGISAQDLRLVTVIASNPEQETVNRYMANHMLGLYYCDRGDFKRALYHAKLAWNLATDAAQRAISLLDQLRCQLAQDGRTALEQKDLPLYDEWVSEVLHGIMDKSADAIQSALTYAELWKDYGVAAAAALAWSSHPENSDPFDQEATEASYHRYKKLFEEQHTQNYSDVIYTRLPEESGQGIPCRAQVRLSFLNGGVPWTPDAFMHKAGSTGSSPAAAPKSREEKRADELMERVDQFARKYSQRARSLYSAKPAVLREYIEMASSVISELEDGNVPLMRAVIDQPEVFEDMQDFLLLSSAATLWMVDPKNTDGREKIAAEKKSSLWLETAVSLAEQLGDHQPLEWRLKELNLPEKTHYDFWWTSLAEHVRDTISG